ncbi:isocitrate lyase/PEP mutase family protein [Pedobacter caeni]|uniref:2-Methylisocitrate lyase, PEP mutase family n=1 Tax=Pedobacter caeni TaxID=288992 RepID=A0A1M4VZR7_9SPHI|nr:isocitrate lyase/phosphoenolpyruvate mutase family protein [Pedobacter caeni]SHE74449.1 2-Methylisocitrate lyase, PEP mutase family [Pedobacter caeni]
MNNYNKFKQLHHQEQALLLGNVWNVNTAQLFEEKGYQAVATSSSAIAQSLGYDDGEQLSFGEMLYIVGRIIKSISIPLTVDLESGYGENSIAIVENIKYLHELGVAGINLEDSDISNPGKLISAEQFSEKVALIKAGLSKENIDIFMNIRTDAFLLNKENALEETLGRIKTYVNSGADGIFVPGIQQEEDIRTVVTASPVPVNVMCLPELSSFEKLSALGVKRLSMGGFMYRYLDNQFAIAIDRIKEEGSFSPLF